MSTVQLAIQNHRYASALSDLLSKDGSHQVLFVEKPDLGLEGIIVVDGIRTENLAFFEAQPERFVVITRKDAGLLARVWDAGVRHVVFEEDSPSTALLAVIAAELRISKPNDRKSLRAAAIPASALEKRFRTKLPELPILQPSRKERAFCRSGLLPASRFIK